MDSDPKKSVVYSGQDCKKELISEDNSNTFEEKHKVALHLDSDSQITADQTPTPTRFIRNCEELGLFQDLQNVNPFDETFRKATECFKTDLSTSPAKCQDMLHTPHIVSLVNEEKFVKESPSKVSEDHKGLILNESNKTQQSVKIANYFAKPVCEESTSARNVNTMPDVSSNDSSDSSDDKLRIISNDEQDSANLKLKRQREINRVAQMRSRARKKHLIAQLFDEADKLKRDKAVLMRENYNLKDQLSRLKAIFDFHRECSVSKDPVINEKIRKLIRRSKQKCMEQNSKPFKQILPNNQKYFTISPLVVPASCFLPTPDTVLNLKKNGSANSQKVSESTNLTKSNTDINSANTKRTNILRSNFGSHTFGQPILLQFPCRDLSTFGTNCSSSKRKQHTQIVGSNKDDSSLTVKEETQNKNPKLGKQDQST